MGIAEHMAAEHLQMLLHLAFGIESPSGVVQIDVLLGIQACILPGAKRIKDSGGIEGRKGAPKGCQGHFHSWRWRGLCIRHKKFSFWGSAILSHTLQENNLEENCTIQRAGRSMGNVTQKGPEGGGLIRNTEASWMLESTRSGAYYNLSFQVSIRSQRLPREARPPVGETLSWHGAVLPQVRSLYRF